MSRPVNGHGAHVGVLALQGAFAAHARVLAALGAHPVEVRTPADLARVDALVMPGGESTTMSMLLESSRLFDPLAARLDDGLPVFGTCAGMILLADRGPRRPRRPALLRRHRHRRAPQRLRPPGRLASRPTSTSSGSTPPFHAVFIRAPVVERAGPASRCWPTTRVARCSCRQGPVTAAAFHPELSRRPPAPPTLPAGGQGLTCPAIRSGPRSSTRRVPRTRPGASSSPS